MCFTIILVWFVVTNYSHKRDMEHLYSPVEHDYIGNRFNEFGPYLVNW